MLRLAQLTCSCLSFLCGFPLRDSSALVSRPPTSQANDPEDSRKDRSSSYPGDPLPCLSGHKHGQSRLHPSRSPALPQQQPVLPRQCKHRLRQLRRFYLIKIAQEAETSITAVRVR